MLGYVTTPDPDIAPIAYSQFKLLRQQSLWDGIISYYNIYGMLYILRIMRSQKLVFWTSQNPAKNRVKPLFFGGSHLILRVHTLGIQSYSQMIGVSNHLLSIVFRFHYHSQKVIGCLAIYWFLKQGTKPQPP